MKSKKPIKVIGLITLVCVSALFGYGLSISNQAMSTPVSVSIESQNLGSYVSGPELTIRRCLVPVGTTGGECLVYSPTVELYGWHENAITNIGRNITRDVLMGKYNGTLQYLELSTDSVRTPNSTERDCPSPVTTGGLGIAEGFVNISASAGYQSGNFSVTLGPTTATTAVAGIYKLCIGNNSASGMANTTFANGWINQSAATPINIGNGDQITRTYYIAMTNGTAGA